MNADRIFLDANILVYAHDLGEPVRRAKAVRILEACWASPVPPSISIQVLQEVHVTLVKKGLPLQESIETVSEFLLWNVVENRVGVFRHAMDVQRRHQLSFWDASIVAAAQASGAAELWSEDFQHERDYDGVLVRNPFLEESGV